MYKFKVFPSLELIHVQDGDVFGLFRVDAITGKLKKVSYAQNQRHLVVHESLDLIETDNGLYRSDGQQITTLTGNTEIFPYQGLSFVVTQSTHNYHVLLVGNNQIFVSMKCQNFVLSSKYYALQISGEWLIFRHLDLVYRIRVESIKIHRNFLLYETPEAQACLYDLHNRKLICKGMQRIIVSDFVKFALCTSTKECVHAYYGSVWHHFTNIEDFGILDDKEKIFYLKKKNKYHLYLYNGQKIFKEEYPEGVDQVYYDETEQSLMIVNQGNAEFLYRA